MRFHERLVNWLVIKRSSMAANTSSVASVALKTLRRKSEESKFVYYSSSFSQALSKMRAEIKVNKDNMGLSQIGAEIN